LINFSEKWYMNNLGFCKLCVARRMPGTKSGYEANPIAARSKVDAQLLAATDFKMNEESKLRGAKDLAWVFPN
jgi:hypothetical protein